MRQQYRAENYRPRNPYRNKFDGKGMSIAGAIPKAFRPSPRISDKEAEDREGKDHQQQEDEGHMGVRRRLVDEAEPAVEHPLGCVSEGDSVLFDISSGCYPEYEKDSLLNSNAE